MGSWDVREIDPHNEQLLRKAWELGKIVDELGRPWSFYWSWETARAQLTQDDPHFERALFGAYDGAELAGTAELELPQMDNLHGVRPGRRLARLSSEVGRRDAT